LLKISSILMTRTKDIHHHGYHCLILGEQINFHGAFMCLKVFFLSFFITRSLERHNLLNFDSIQFKWFKGRGGVPFTPLHFYLQTPETKEADWKIWADWHTKCSVTGLFTLVVINILLRLQCAFVPREHTRGSVL
jgi:hypothetical protein